MKHSSGLKKIIAKTGLSLLILFLILIYYKIEWGTWTIFVTSIDDCSLLFCDFVRHYYPMGKTILSSPFPVSGFFYSAFFAVILSPLGITSLKIAVNSWAIVQLTTGVLLFIVSVETTSIKKTSFMIPSIIIFFMSFPILHNFKWGQVSVLITLLVIASLFAYSKKYNRTAAFLLACATSIKYYPILFIIYFFIKRDWRFIITFGAFIAFLLVIIPAVVIGPSETITFHKLTNDALMTSDWITSDINSQYITHVFKRIFSFLPNSTGVDLFISSLGIVLVGCNIGLIFIVQYKRMILSPAFSFTIIFLSLPLLIKTSWPHYFVFLPFCQLTFIKIVFQRSTQLWKRLLLLSFVALSIVLSNVVFFAQWPHWSAYSYWGCLFFSDIILLLGFYGIFITDGITLARPHRISST